MTDQPNDGTTPSDSPPPDSIAQRRDAALSSAQQAWQESAELRFLLCKSLNGTMTESERERAVLVCAHVRPLKK